MKNSGFEEHPLVLAADHFPDRPALIYGKRTIPYTELLQRADNLFQGISEQGLKQGDIVVLDDLTPEETILSFWACSLGGFIAFPVNTRFPESVLHGMVMHVEAKLILSHRRLDPDLSISPETVYVESGNKRFDKKNFEAEDGVSLLMTSGSSGPVKIVQHSFRNHLASAMGSNKNIPLAADDNWLLSLPLYHVGGLSILFRTAVAGASIVIPQGERSLIETISDSQASHISLVATQFQRLLGEPEVEEVLARMKAILLGGGTISTPLIHTALSQGLPIHVSYGSTEMSSQICTTSSMDRKEALKSSGKLLEGRDLLISHEGEILVKGDTLASGYLNGTQLMDIRDSQGWFHTGDIGTIDTNACVTIIGRLDNQFISGGENIQPEYIERALLKIPGIIEAIVLPKTDREFGSRPVAYLRTEKPITSAQEIADDLRKSLPGFMVPVAFYELPAALLEEGLKLSRQDLAEFVTGPNNQLHSIK